MTLLLLGLVLFLGTHSVRIFADSICLHGDSPAAVRTAQVLRASLLSGALLTFATVIGELTLATFLPRPAFGPYLAARHPVRYSRTPAGIRRPPPGLGEHTRAIMQEAGFSEQDGVVIFALGQLAQPRRHISAPFFDLQIGAQPCELPRPPDATRAHSRTVRQRSVAAVSAAKAEIARSASTVRASGARSCACRRAFGSTW